MVYFNSHITGQYNPLYTLNNQGSFFHCSHGFLIGQGTWSISRSLLSPEKPTGAPFFFHQAVFFGRLVPHWIFCCVVFCCCSNPKHPRKINGWNLTITQFKRKFIFQISIFGFQPLIFRGVKTFRGKTSKGILLRVKAFQKEHVHIWMYIIHIYSIPRFVQYLYSNRNTKNAWANLKLALGYQP